MIEEKFPLNVNNFEKWDRKEGLTDKVVASNIWEFFLQNLHIPPAIQLLFRIYKTQNKNTQIHKAEIQKQ